VRTSGSPTRNLSLHSRLSNAGCAESFAQALVLVL
jgi:hypothetical protein